MKPFHFLTCFLLLSFFFSIDSNAQTCEPYYPLETGVVFELTTYNSKEKVTGYQLHEVLEVTGGENHIEATVKVTHLDKKRKDISTIDYTMVCDGDVFHIDMRSMMPSSTGSTDMEMTIESENLDLPSNMSVGMELPDASMTATMSANNMGINLGGIKVEITERKVTAEETQETPAGTFDCMVLMQKEHSKMMAININSTSKVWYSKGNGMVRSEYYDKKGKLRSYSVLTKLER